MTPEKLFLKRATGELVKGLGGLEAAAEFCRVGKSVLGECQSINNADRFIAIDVVADLEPLAREREGWPHVTRALCAMMGGAFVALPDAGPGGGDVLGALGAAGKEFGDISQAICGGFADGHFCSRDAAAARQQVREAQAVLAQMDALLRAIEGGAR